MAVIFDVMVIAPDLDAQEFLHAFGKAMEKVVGLEHQQVARQQGFEQFATFRENAKRVRAWPGRMPEDCDRLGRQRGLDEAGYQGQVKVMHPHKTGLPA